MFRGGVFALLVLTAVAATQTPRSLSQVSRTKVVRNLAGSVALMSAWGFSSVPSVRAASGTSASDETTKNIIFLRHSRTENNEYLHEHGWLPGFTDPGLRDTHLSEGGQKLVESLNNKILRGEENVDLSKVDLLAVSPLRRTLQTATIGLDRVLLNRPDHATPKSVICPLAAERVYMDADAGRPRSVLELEWPQFDFSELPSDDSPWWWTGDPKTYQEWRVPGDYRVLGEPRDVFGQRMVRLKQWLQARPEQTIMVVTHWGTIFSLTGQEFENCQVGQFNVDALLSDEEIMSVKV